jgi:hypothetical protein
LPIPVDVGGKRKVLHDPAQHRVLVGSLDFPVNPAGREQLGYRWNQVRRSARFVEQLPRDRDAVRDGPFPELDGVEVKPLVDLVDRKVPIGDPAADGRFVHAQIGRRFADGELHGLVRIGRVRD